VISLAFLAGLLALLVVAAISEILGRTMLLSVGAADADDAVVEEVELFLLWV
jgi:hypothetical protein